MARDVGLQHAVSGSRSQSGFSIPSLLNGRRPAGTRHLTQKIARSAGIGLPHTSSQLPMSTRRVGGSRCHDAHVGCRAEEPLMSWMIASRVRCDATVSNATIRPSVVGSLVIVAIAVTFWSAVAHMG